MKNDNNNTPEPADDGSEKNTGKNLPGNSPQTDPKEPWRQIVAAAETYAEALVSYRQAVEDLQQELAAAAATKNDFDKFGERLAAVEHTQGNGGIQRSPARQSDESLKLQPWWFWAVIALWLTALSGTLLGHISNEHRKSEAAVSRLEGAPR